METAEPLTWRKSSYSTSNGGNCVEVGSAPGTIAVRDSKAPRNLVLNFSREKWQLFAGRIKVHG